MAIGNYYREGVVRQIPYRPHIDGLRAVTVLAVVLSHAFPPLLPGGFIDVDVFLVIPGYLISRIPLRELQHRQFSITGFYARRVRRIFASLLAVMPACLAFGWYAVPRRIRPVGQARGWRATGLRGPWPSGSDTHWRQSQARCRRLRAAALWLAFTAPERFPGWRMCKPVAAAMMLIAAGPGAWFNRAVLGSRPMVAIGLISYPLYL